MRVAGLVLPLVIGVGLAVTSCGSTPAKPAAAATHTASRGSSPGTIPAGYTRVGGAAQGISVAAPSAWVAVNLAKQTVESVASQFHLRGFSATTLVQDMETLQKLHAVFVFDLRSAVDSPRHFSRNLNAYCVPSGITEVGAAGVPAVTTGAAAEFQRLGATHIVQKNLKVGGIPGVETSYQLYSSNVGAIYGSQLEVLPKPDKACFVTVTFGVGESLGNAVSVAAATAQFP